jgi:hypothetical protein
MVVTRADGGRDDELFGLSVEQPPRLGLTCLALRACRLASNLHGENDAAADDGAQYGNEEYVCDDRGVEHKVLVELDGHARLQLVDGRERGVPVREIGTRSEGENLVEGLG